MNNVKKLSFLFAFILMLSVSGVFAQGSSSLRFLNETISQADRSMNRLSSGRLLWTDSAASSAIYEKLETQVTFLAVNIRNSEDMVSYYRSREGYLQSMSSYIQRIRELILKRSNSLYGPDEIEIIDSEIHMNYTSMLRELSWAQFNTVSMFSSWMESDELTSRFREGNFYTLEGIDRISQAILSERARIGAVTSALQNKIQGMAVEQENTQSFQSNGDTDFGRELSNMKANEIKFFANVFLLKYEN